MPGSAPLGWWEPPLPPAGLVTLLRDFTYRPGWVIAPDTQVTLVTPASWYLMVISLVQNSMPGDHEWVRVWHMIALPDDRDQDWMTWLLSALADIDDHERCEWFRVRGALPFDPHAA